MTTEEKEERLEELKERFKKLEQREVKLLEVIKLYQLTHKNEYFKPLPYQQKVIDLLHQNKKTIVLVGANKIGKTTLATNIIVSFVLGTQGWDKKLSIFEGKPTRGRIIAVDWEKTIGEVIIPALKEWLPRGTYTTRKNNIGVDTYWTFNNGSTIELMTHSQDTVVHEGWNGDWVWSDEVLPRDKYIANKRGLVANNGVFLITMTALSNSSWVLDELVLNVKDPSIGCITNISIEANTYLSQQAIQNFINACSDEEKEARIKGGWLELIGLVLKEFEKDIHIVKSFEIPQDWIVTALIDLHLNLPQAIGFYAVNEKDCHYVIDEVWKNLSPEEIGGKIVELKEQYKWNLDYAYIDPLAKGDNQYVKNRVNIDDSFTIIERELRKGGIILDIASKDKDSGIRNLKNWLKGPNKMPSLYFFDKCQRHLYEIVRWVYDKDGKPKKENDHFMENLYRYTLTPQQRYVERFDYSKLKYIRLISS
ncbi:MAG: DEAD/DEAH box helicase family protein [bacterium]